MCYSLLQLDRADDASILLESCLSVIQESQLQEYQDALPEESPVGSVKEGEMLYRFRLAVLRVMLNEEEASGFLKRLFDAVGGKSRDELCQSVRREELAETIEKMEAIVVRSLLRQCNCQSSRVI